MWRGKRRVQKNNQHFKQFPRLLPGDRLEPGTKNKEQKRGRSEEEEKKKHFLLHNVEPKRDKVASFVNSEETVTPP